MQIILKKAYGINSNSNTIAIQKNASAEPARMLILKNSKDSKVRAKSLVLADNGFLGF